MNARLICKCSANRKFMKTAEKKKVEKISNPLIGDEHFLQIKVMNIYANYKVEYFLILKRVDFAQKKEKEFVYSLYYSYICYYQLLNIK